MIGIRFRVRARVRLHVALPGVGNHRRKSGRGKRPQHYVASVRLDLRDGSFRLVDFFCGDS